MKNLVYVFLIILFYGCNNSNDIDVVISDLEEALDSIAFNNKADDSKITEINNLPKDTLFLGFWYNMPKTEVNVLLNIHKDKGILYEDYIQGAYEPTKGTYFHYVSEKYDWKARIGIEYENTKLKKIFLYLDSHHVDDTWKQKDFHYQYNYLNDDPKIIINTYKNKYGKPNKDKIDLKSDYGYIERFIWYDNNRTILFDIHNYAKYSLPFGDWNVIGFVESNAIITYLNKEDYNEEFEARKKKEQIEKDKSKEKVEYIKEGI